MNAVDQDVRSCRFRPTELRILRIWCDSEQSRGLGGRNPAQFPGEVNLMGKLNETAGERPINLSTQDLRMLCSWTAHSAGTPEEQMLSERIKKMLIKDCE